MKTKMAAVFAALMIALMVAGFAYAHWEKIVTIEGTVNTGKLHLIPSFKAKTDDTKGVCTVSWTIVGNDLTVTIDKAYPCITVTGTFDLYNDGTIPAGFHDVVVTAPSGVTWDLSTPGVIKVYDGTALVATGTYTIYGDFKQIDPNENPYIEFTLHFEEDLPQDTTYTFTIKLIYYNWNEA